MFALAHKPHHVEDVIKDAKIVLTSRHAIVLGGAPITTASQEAFKLAAAGHTVRPVALGAAKSVAASNGEKAETELEFKTPLPTLPNSKKNELARNDKTLPGAFKTGGIMLVERYRIIPNDPKGPAHHRRLREFDIAA